MQDDIWVLRYRLGSDAGWTEEVAVQVSCFEEAYARGMSKMFVHHPNLRYCELDGIVRRPNV